MRRYRWGDDDRYWGPFTYSPKGRSFNPLAFILKSAGSAADEYSGNGCALRIGAFGRSLIIALPPIIRPWRAKVYARSWDAETVQRLGRDWYWDVHPREFGWSYSDGHLSVKYGRSTHDSSTDMSWGCFLPWTQWRHVRHSFYGAQGEHFATVPEIAAYSLDGGKSFRPWEIAQQIEDSCPKVMFRIQDFDGEEIEATARIEEREWLFGTGWFKWLSLFCRPKIRRSLCIRFSGEVGREKGSWKGGVYGTGIDMRTGEGHEQAFRRFCDEEHRSKSGKYRLTFLSGPE